MNKSMNKKKKQVQQLRNVDRALQKNTSLYGFHHEPCLPLTHSLHSSHFYLSVTDQIQNTSNQSYISK